MEGEEAMTRVVAAMDDTPGAGAVLASAAAVAQLFDATLEAVHVRSDGCEIATGHTLRASVPLEIVDGGVGVVESLVAVGREHDVAALVLGTREEHTADKPLGSTALAVVGGVEKPIVLIPPRAAPLERIRRVLLPLEGSRRTSLAPASVLEVAHSAAVDVIVLHVFDEASLPEFTDQPQHETEVWANEFLARYCPVGLRSVSLALRIGEPAETVVRVAEESAVDLIALGWNQRLVPGRAAIVRAVLERGRLPLMLIPATTNARGGQSSDRLVRQLLEH
jgi:nucleotide-binding universal stress UspA family protein